MVGVLFMMSLHAWSDDKPVRESERLAINAFKEKALSGVPVTLTGVLYSRIKGAPGLLTAEGLWVSLRPEQLGRQLGEDQGVVIVSGKALFFVTKETREEWEELSKRQSKSGYAPEKYVLLMDEKTQLAAKANASQKPDKSNTATKNAE